MRRGIGAFIAVMVWSSAAAAGDPVRADALFREAQAQVQAGDLDRACALFAESEALEPAAGTSLNRADCEERRGKLATAHELFVRAKETLPAGDERIPYAAKRAAALAPRVPKIVLRAAPGTPASLVVKSEHSVLRAAAFGVPLPLDPGTHRYEASAPGFAPRVFVVTLAAGETKTLEVAPGDKVSTSDPAARPQGSATLGWVIGGAGVVALATGIVTGVAVLSHVDTYKEHCTPGCDEEGARAARLGRPLAIVSPVALGLGAVGIGVGAYLVLASGRTRARVGAGAVVFEQAF